MKDFVQNSWPDYLQSLLKQKKNQFLRETAHIEFYEFNHINKNLICLNQIAKTSYFILV